MSSAAKHKQDHLEEEFRRRMHDAEATPSADLWARIDYDLTVQENKLYKSRFGLYRQLAAACLVLFVLAGGLLAYHFNNDEKVSAGVAAVQFKATAPDSSPAEAPALAVAAPLAKSTAHQAYNAAPVVKAKRQPQAAAPAANLTKSIEAAGAKGTRYAAETWQYASSEKAGLEENTVRQRHGIESQRHLFNPERGAESKTAFKSLQSFYQAARRTMAAVPNQSSSHSIQSSLAAQQLLRNAALPQAARELNQLAGHRNNQTAEQLALNSNSSEKDSGSAKDSRWTIGMAYAPSYFDQNIGMSDQVMSAVSMRSFAPGGPAVDYAATQDMEEAREEFEKNTEPGFSYAVDGKVGFRLGKKWKLLAGLGFSQNTARTKSSYVVQKFLQQSHGNAPVALAPSTALLPSLARSTDSISVARTDDYSVNYRYRHLTLPVGVQFEGRLSKDWYWFSGAGVAANFLLQTTIMASNQEVKDFNYDYNDDSPFRKVQFSGNVAAGVGKHLSKAVSVSVGPEFRGYFDSLLAEQGGALAPQGKPYTFGINMALNYSLGSGAK